MSNPGTPTRILLVDDSPELLSAWVRLLAREPDLEVVGALESLAGLTEILHARTPHVLVLDISVGDTDGLAVLPDLTAAAPDLRVIVYSGHAEPGLLHQLKAAGVAGFVGKHQPPARLLAAIRAAAAGGTAFPDDR